MDCPCACHTYGPDGAWLRAQCPCPTYIAEAEAARAAEQAASTPTIAGFTEDFYAQSCACGQPGCDRCDTDDDVDDVGDSDGGSEADGGG